MPASDLWFVVPGDPDQNTGGYRYVQRLAAAIRQAGVNVQVQGLDGTFPKPDDTATAAMDSCLSSLPEGCTVVLDGLAMGAMPGVLQRHRNRLRLIALVHHPLADETGLAPEQRDWFREAERQALAQAERVVTTSRYTADRLMQGYGVDPAKLATAEPAVDDLFFSLQRKGPREPPTILCVGHLSRRKAQHQLVEALVALQVLPWRCVLAGSQDRDPGYANEVRQAIKLANLGDRIELTGELSQERLAAAYENADLFVFPSVYEGYGMVIDEALAAGLPVVSSDGGALASTANKAGAQTFAAGDTTALAARLRVLLSDRHELIELARQASQSRERLRRWSDAAGDFTSALALPKVSDPARFSNHWLEAREGSDHLARNSRLTESLAYWLESLYNTQAAGNQAAAPLHLVDIGAGRGSNPSYLVPRLPVPQRWTLIEPDQHLLQTACRRVEALDAPAEPLPVELTRSNLGQVLPADAALISASALIDLVSDDWLKTFAAAVVHRKAAVLVVLSYSGQFDLEPCHESDALMRKLVNQHQHGDKGSGSALGPEAARVLAQALADGGYRVVVEPSPWRLGSKGGQNDNALINMLMAGWAEAACQQDPSAAPAVKAWLRDRQQQLARGELQVVVEHLDLLGLPETETTK